METSELKNILKLYDIKPSKSKGQNFLLDEHVLDEMLLAGKVTKDDYILEVGPGLGVLTKRLAETAKQVLAIELDKKIIGYFQANMLPFHSNITLIEGDALSSETFSKYVEWLNTVLIDMDMPAKKSPEHKARLRTLDHSYKVIANLPYRITSKILRQFLESHPRPSMMVVMLQKEVAERITARPGQMSLLALSVQAYGKPEIVRIVKSQAFYPEPEVDSAILKCDLTNMHPEYAKLDDLQRKMFWRLAKSGFSARRKQLKNNLKTVLGDKMDEVFKKTGISGSARAQELGVEDWVKMVFVL